MSLCGTIPNDGTCFLIAYVIWVPGIVFMAWMPYKIKVLSRYLHFPALDEKTSTISRCLYIICVSEAVLALAFMGRDFSSTILILCQLIVAASWGGCTLIIHKEVWNVDEWPCHEVRVFFFSNLFVNLLQTVYLVTPTAPLLAVPVLSLLITACGLGIIYLKELFYQPSELDKIALDRVSVDIYDGHPLAPPNQRLSFTEGLLDSEEGTKPHTSRLFRLFSWDVREKDNHVQHEWFSVDTDGDDPRHNSSPSDREASVLSELSGVGVSSRNTTGSPSRLYDHNLGQVSRDAVQPALANSLIVTPTKAREGGGGAGTGDKSSPNLHESPPTTSVAVSRAFENQRKRQAQMASFTSPLKSEPKHQPSQRAGVRTSPPKGAALSVSVDKWRWRTTYNATSSSPSGSADTVLPTFTPQVYGMALHDMDRGSTSDGQTDQESPASPMKSTSDDNLLEGDVEFGISITQWPLQVNPARLQDGGFVGSIRSSESAWSPKPDSGTGEGVKAWTVWRTAKELLDMHDQIILVNGTTNGNTMVVPRKPRFKGDAKAENDLTGDRRAIGIYLNTFLRFGLDSLPPILLSFLEIRESEALSLLPKSPP